MTTQRGKRRCRVTEMKVAAMDGSAEVTLDKVHSVPKLNVGCDNLVTAEQASRWKHLEDVPLHLSLIHI